MLNPCEVYVSSSQYNYCNVGATDCSLLYNRPSHVFQHTEETSRSIQEKELKSGQQVSSAFTPKLHPIPQQVLTNIVSVL